ncbi:hypothetical protein PEBR_18470 [Penicillium brasilianum]|uniref:BZIP domain-containing protein n=1 Tax=Penicillium brasilianum TaxID=104259 RepID=A0A1S9RNQ7_PENBI|nr:hypothetical protein PEBR_18470 [Penicillium brasilianum]
MDFCRENEALASSLQSESMADPERSSASSPSYVQVKRRCEAHTKATRVKKRIVTAARREQNKTAQRAYRERQKGNRKFNIAPCGKIRSIAPRPSPGSLSSSLSDLQISSDAPISNCQAKTALIDNAETTPGKALVRVADPLSNTLQTTRDTIWLAILNNALCLGFDLEKLADCSTPYMSPFYRPITPKDTPRDVVASTLDTSLPIHLQPTMAQILIPHHASLDLIPLPLLRERAIMMTFAMPDIFNLWDLKLDIYTRHALICRRYVENGACHPWDSRSWEAKPWFMQKWSMAVEG